MHSFVRHVFNCVFVVHWSIWTSINKIIFTGLWKYIEAMAVELALFLLCFLYLGPGVYSHSFRDVPTPGRECLTRCTSWWTTQTVDPSLFYKGNSETAATPRSQYSTTRTYHSFCQAAHLECKHTTFTLRNGFINGISTPSQQINKGKLTF